MIFRSLVHPIKKKFSNMQKKSNATELAGSSSRQPNSNFNQYFPHAFKTMISSRKVLLIFSEADRLYWEFEEKFMGPYKEEFKKHESNFNIHIVKNANHIFSFKEWVNDMLDRSANWISKEYIQQ